MKRNQRGHTSTELIVLVFLVVIAVGWVKNLLKLADCDFQAPYKAEVIHAVGLFPLIGMVTGWMDFGR